MFTPLLAKILRKEMRNGMQRQTVPGNAVDETVAGEASEVALRFKPLGDGSSASETDNKKDITTGELNQTRRKCRTARWVL